MNIKIKSSRILLRPFSATDAEEAFQCITPSLTRLMAWEPPADRGKFDRIWRSWMPLMQEASEFIFTVRQISDGAFLGLAGLHHVQTGTPELGIWIRENRHREGYGREAVALVAKWATQTFNPGHFKYPVAEDNGPSRRIAESLGGVLAGSRTTTKYKSVVYEIPRQRIEN